MKMENKSIRTVALNGINYVANSAGYYYAQVYFPQNETKESELLEKIVIMFGKLGLGTCKYQDYGCCDRDAFIKALKAIAKYLLKIKYAKRVIIDHRRQSRRLSRALKLVEKKNKYRSPSSSLVDSS